MYKLKEQPRSAVIQQFISIKTEIEFPCYVEPSVHVDRRLTVKRGGKATNFSEV